MLVFSGEAYESLLHTVPALTTDADRRSLIRLDVAADAPTDVPADVPRVDVPTGAPDKADSSLCVGGYETFLRAAHQRTQDAAATPWPRPTLPPPPPRSRRVSLTLRRVVSVQSVEQVARQVESTALVAPQRAALRPLD